MQIVIDISEKDYQSMKDGHVPFNVLNVIMNGTPLPKDLSMEMEEDANSDKLGIPGIQTNYAGSIAISLAQIADTFNSLADDKRFKITKESLCRSCNKQDHESCRSLFDRDIEVSKCPYYESLL